MANEENLVPMSKRSKSEAREFGKKGGIVSGKTRRKKSDLKKALQTVLTATVPSDKTATMLERLGFENTNEMAIMLSLAQQAMKGNVRAVEIIHKMVNNEKDEIDIKEQKERIKKLQLENRKLKELLLQPEGQDEKIISLLNLIQKEVVGSDA